MKSLVSIKYIENAMDEDFQVFGPKIRSWRTFKTTNYINKLKLFSVPY